MSETPDSFWVYILQNPAGKFYIGSTGNLSNRIAQHNDPAGPITYTHKNGPWVLVWSESHPDRPSAVRREREIKSKKSSRWIRENLLNGRVPTSRD